MMDRLAELNINISRLEERANDIEDQLYDMQQEFDGEDEDTKPAGMRQLESELHSINNQIAHMEKELIHLEEEEEYGY